MNATEARKQSEVNLDRLLEECAKEWIILIDKGIVERIRNPGIQGYTYVNVPSMPSQVALKVKIHYEGREYLWKDLGTNTYDNDDIATVSW